MPRQNGTRALREIEIDELMEHSNLGLRTQRAAAHAARIAALLDKPAERDMSHHVWRMRYWLDDDYTVATIDHNLYPKTTVEGKKEAAVITFVARGFHRVPSVVTQAIGGAYSADEIVAFLRLDLVDPETVEWKDETPRSQRIAIVSDVVGSALRKLDG